MQNYLHLTPGRIRIKNALIKNCVSAKKRIVDLLSTSEGINSVKVNIETGSVLIHFDGDKITSDHIISELSTAGYFTLSEVISAEELISKTVSQIGYKISRTIFTTCVKHALQATPMAIIAELL